MISAQTALERVLRLARPLGSEAAALERACGRVLAKPIRARLDLPSFDNSAMDGYAVRTADLKRASARRPVELAARGRIAAGSAAPRRLTAGQALRIMTGAPIPVGADAVVRQEDVVVDGAGGARFSRAARAAAWIRRRGEDVRRGDLLLAAGLRLRPWEISLLAAQGFERVRVVRRPKVAVVSTGSELAAPRRRPGPGLIHDANGPALRCALRGWGLPVVDLGVVADESARLKAALRRALDEADVVVVSGGVSVGDHDLTRPALEELGARTVFWRVRIKPGKPLHFAIRGRTLIFGLPGNPVSVLVCLEEFVRPALEAMERSAPAARRFNLAGRARDSFDLPSDRRQYILCRAVAGGGGWELRIPKPQASHRLAAVGRVNALAFPPEGSVRVRPGDRLDFRLLD